MLLRGKQDLKLKDMKHLRYSLFHFFSIDLLIMCCRKRSAWGMQVGRRKNAERTHLPGYAIPKQPPRIMISFSGILNHKKIQLTLKYVLACAYNSSFSKMIRYGATSALLENLSICRGLNRGPPCRQMKRKDGGHPIPSISSSRICIIIRSSSQVSRLCVILVASVHGVCQLIQSDLTVIRDEISQLLFKVPALSHKSF